MIGLVLVLVLVLAPVLELVRVLVLVLVLDGYVHCDGHDYDYGYDYDSLRTPMSYSVRSLPTIKWMGLGCFPWSIFHVRSCTRQLTKDAACVAAAPCMSSHSRGLRCSRPPCMLSRSRPHASAISPIAVTLSSAIFPITVTLSSCWNQWPSQPTPSIHFCSSGHHSEGGFSLSWRCP